MPNIKPEKLVPNVVSAVAVRSRLGQILKRVEQKNERFVVDRHGQPQAVIMSIRDYVNTFAPAPTWLKAIGREAKQKGLNKLTLRQINAEIATTRRERRSSR
ncbi:MAG: type II toxin-antitoxin system Phd/YefM family antitoxin [Bryobacterales bacterium]|nr:type II toxin-antitoxin system Phd/YefM family antitoxin [Bryobacterales bacterium]